MTNVGHGVDQGGCDRATVGLMTAAEAEAIVLALAVPLAETEVVSVAAAAGRVLAESVRSRLDFPHWDNSAMDGYAVRSADVATATAAAPAVLTVVTEIPAGRPPDREVGPGQAARIYTGAMLPEGADAIVMQEDTERLGPDDAGCDRVAVRGAIAPGTFVRRRGAFSRTGDGLLTAGTAIGPAEVAVLAAARCTPVRVYGRPRVAILSTGDELVPADGERLEPGQIVDSNGYALAAFAARLGCDVVPMGIVPDDRAALAAAMNRAIATADVVLSTGGVSVGEYDYVEELLDAVGADIRVRSVAVKPGKPLTVATIPAREGRPSPCLYFGLPGNPASALVGCWRFVAPALRKISGIAGTGSPQRLQCVAAAALRGAGTRETYLWGRLELRGGLYRFVPAAGGHNSGNLVNLVGTTALAIVPMGCTAIAAGEPVEVFPLS